MSISDGFETVAPFILKIYEIVSDRSIDGIVSWTREGDAFIVKEPQVFADKVMLNYFKTKLFCTFVRQLNFYGFAKKTSSSYGSRAQKFKHPHFRRGEREKLHLIKKKVKKAGEATRKMISKLQAEIKHIKQQHSEDINLLKKQYQHLITVQHQLIFALNNSLSHTCPPSLSFSPTGRAEKLIPAIDNSTSLVPALQTGRGFGNVNLSGNMKIADLGLVGIWGGRGGDGVLSIKGENMGLGKKPSIQEVPSIENPSIHSTLPTINPSPTLSPSIHLPPLNEGKGQDNTGVENSQKVSEIQTVGAATRTGEKRSGEDMGIQSRNRVKKKLRVSSASTTPVSPSVSPSVDAYLSLSPMSVNLDYDFPWKEETPPSLNEITPSLNETPPSLNEIQPSSDLPSI
ncbi:hypothetical protein AAMO2058_000407900 [Amorphochlora amoebiformis]